MGPQPHDGDLGTVLAVFAHPDDEAYLAGGLMARAADRGSAGGLRDRHQGELGFADDDPDRSTTGRSAARGGAARPASTCSA